MTTQHRAYSVLTVKGMDEEKRELTGIATTPSTDRMGDVVEPKGAEFKLPIPLLWQHDSRQPIGHVTHAKIGEAGIEIRARLARVDEPGRLKERLDEAWQSIKAGLVKGLSIGFSAREHSYIEGGGIRFSKWDWHELSAVTIPANADASILAIKAADQAHRRAAPGARPVVRLDPAPAASGNPAPGVSGHTRRPGVVYLKP